MQDRQTDITEEAPEMKNLPAFIEKKTTIGEPPRCVDGRPSTHSEQGPQTLGGSLHPILLAAIFQNADFDENMVTNSLASLHGSGLKTGAHRGAHAHNGASDCGFADRMKDVLATAVSKRDLITERLQQIVQANQDKLDLNPPSFAKLLDLAFEKIGSYSPEKIKITGAPLVRIVEDTNSKIETVVGDHAEEVAFVNVKEDTTLDTIDLNGQGHQAFNLDLPTAIDHAKRLDVPEEFTIPSSLILLLATEIVLVEDKGKPALPVEVHSQLLT